MFPDPEQYTWIMALTQCTGLRTLRLRRLASHLCIALLASPSLASLTELSLQDVTNMDVEVDWSSVFRSCKQLRSLHYMADDDRADPGARCMLTALTEHCSELTSLCLDLTSPQQSKLLQLVAAGLPHLKSLTLRHMSKMSISNVDWPLVWRSLTQLTELQLVECRGFYSMLDAMQASCCTKLQRLTIHTFWHDYQKATSYSEVFDIETFACVSSLLARKRTLAVTMSSMHAPPMPPHRTVANVPSSISRIDRLRTSFEFILQRFLRGAGRDQLVRPRWEWKSISLYGNIPQLALMYKPLEFLEYCTIAVSELFGH
jgi:hypothetical protein